MPLEPIEVIAQVGEVLDSLGARWLVGGSVASSFHGIPRSTNNVDLVADIREDQGAPLVSALSGDFYISEAAVREAVRRRSSFNLIHLQAMLKVDVFVADSSRLAVLQLDRRTTHDLAPGYTLPISSAEDVILQKLRSFELGQRVSERQWRDVQGILQARGDRLDHCYLSDEALAAGLSELLIEAMAEARAAREKRGPPSLP